jgi:hypothetical protein
LDVTNEANFTGSVVAGTCPAVFWECELDIYGAKAVIPQVINEYFTSAVSLSASPDGYYMYLYFLFTNGYVVGVQFDCIDM